MLTRWNNIMRTVNVFAQSPSIACNLSVNNASLHKGVDLANKLPTTPRLIKTHLPVQFIPKSFWEQNCRVNAVHTQCFKRQNVTSWRTSGLLSLIRKLSISASVCLPTQIVNIWRFWDDSVICQPSFSVTLHFSCFNTWITWIIIAGLTVCRWVFFSFCR